MVRRAGRPDGTGLEHFPGSEGVRSLAPGTCRDKNLLIADLRTPRRVGGRSPTRPFGERAALGLWVATAGFLLLPFVSGIPRRYSELVDPCGPGCADRLLGVLDASQHDRLSEIGLDPRLYAWWDLGRESALAIVGVVLGTVLISRVGTPVAFLTATVMVAFGAVLVPEVPAAADRAGVLPTPVGEAVWVVATTTVIVPWYLLPTGHFVRRWMWIPAVATLLTWVALLFADDGGDPPSILLLAALGLLGFGVGAQVYRYRRAVDEVERQQLKWLGIGLLGWVATLVVYVAFVQGGLLDPKPGGLAYPLTYLAFGAIATASAAVFPFSWSVAILQHRLWDADRILSRGALVVTATGGVVVTYLLAVFVVAAVAGHHTDAAGPVAAALLVGLTLWMRDPLTRRVTRLFYGQRDAPYELLTSLWTTANQRRPDADTLTLLTRRLVESLHLSAGRVMVTGDTGVLLDETLGEPTGEPTELVLRFGGDALGTLWVWPRRGEGSLSGRDVKLISDASAPLAHLAATVRLTGDLRRSRAALVNAREEERRRIHRDLHDDLGPTLAGQVLLLDAAATTSSDDPLRSGQFLAKARLRTDELVEHVRRLSHGLRAPALDQLGLGPSLLRAASVADSAGVHVAADIGELPELSAAVETATYRIVTEALTNALRHSGASSVHVMVGLDGHDLIATVVDDGCGGVPDTGEGSRNGVGLRSMHSRARELGGEVRIRSEIGQGTMIHMRVPRGADV